MSRVNSVLALLGGAAMGAIIALLLAPAKGEETREKIAEVLREKGIKLNKEDFNKLIDSIEARFRKKDPEDAAVEETDE
jgi:gas vesicle protein